MQISEFKFMASAAIDQRGFLVLEKDFEHDNIIVKIRALRMNIWVSATVMIEFKTNPMAHRREQRGDSYYLSTGNHHSTIGCGGFFSSLEDIYEAVTADSFDSLDPSVLERCLMIGESLRNSSGV